MLSRLEAALLSTFLDAYIRQYGEQMAKEIPGPYVVLRSAQTKLHEMEQQHAH